MDHDDAPIGRLLSRREALALVGVGGAAVALGCTPSPAEGSPAAGAASASPCLVRPEQTEGPFFFEGDLLRSDIRTDTGTGEARPGVPLALAVAVSTVEDGACVPLPGALVDVWHCDAAGRYSGYASEGTEGRDFLRGVQRTDGGGVASFQTVYPGWYRGRAVHVHLKVRTDEAPGGYEFTSQLYFPDDVSDAVFEDARYGRGGARLRNDADGLFRRDRGAELTLAPRPEGDGYAASFAFGLDLSDTAVGAADGFRSR